jgi:hypothetical protein
MLLSPCRDWARVELLGSEVTSIGHGSDPKPAPPPDYVAAKAPSAEQSALSKAALQTINWAGKGDFRDPREGGLFINYANPALNEDKNTLIANEAGQGIEGLGTADPNYLASLQENQKAHRMQDAAGQYESDIGKGVSAATGVAESTAGLSQAEQDAILKAQSSAYNTSLGKAPTPQWWQFLASAAGPAVAAI